MPNENDNKLVTLADLAEAYNALYNRDVTTTATQSADGLMSSTDKTKLDGIDSGAQVNSITGVKGNAESSYRTGNVNITPKNIGAVAKSGDTMTGPLKWASATALPAKSRLQYFLGIDVFADGGTTHYITAANLLAAIGAVSTSNVINVTHGGTNATSALGAVQNLFDTGVDSITQYPDKPGIYRVISDIFNNMNPSGNFGVLVIFRAVYAMHIYIDLGANLYIGYSSDTFGEPATWKKVTTTVQS